MGFFQPVEANEVGAGFADELFFGDDFFQFVLVVLLQPEQVGMPETIGKSSI